ncbi:unnamed protein product, partial [Timema podura]|nr:unnamed protein product [Timema podura]
VLCIYCIEQPARGRHRAEDWVKARWTPQTGDMFEPVSAGTRLNQPRGTGVEGSWSNIAICFPGPWVKLSGGTMFKSYTLLLQKGSGDMKIGAIQYLTLLLVLSCGHGSKKTPKSL